MKAWELIADPKKWTKYAAARDHHGASVSPRDRRAACFCARAAIRRCYGFDGEAAALAAVAAAIPGDGAPHSKLIDWNDRPERTHAEVVALLKAVDV